MFDFILIAVFFVATPGGSARAGEGRQAVLRRRFGLRRVQRAGVAGRRRRRRVVERRAATTAAERQLCVRTTTASRTVHGQRRARHGCLPPAGELPATVQCVSPAAGARVVVVGLHGHSSAAISIEGMKRMT